MSSVNHYEDLKYLLEKNGCFEQSSNYLFRFTLVSFIFFFGYTVLLIANSVWMYVLALSALGLITVQSGFLAHDAGDGAVTNNNFLKTLLPQLFMTLIGGLSFGYFMELHNIHHKTMSKGSTTTSKPVNEYEFKGLKKLVSFNPSLFMVTTIIMRGFTLKLEGIKYLFKNYNKLTDILFLLGHFFLWIVIPSLIIGLETAVLNYLLVTLLAGIYVGIILIVNHAGMATSIDYANLPLMERVGCTTRNLGEGWFSDFIWGGINNHVEHHLYPSLPASKLGKARKIVKKYYQTHGLPYHESNFFTALNEALNYFKEISPLDRVMEPLN